MSALSKLDLLELVTRNSILQDVSATDQFGFVINQIDNPFTSGDMNYFKQLEKSTPDTNLMNDYCLRIIEAIGTRYQHLDFNLENYDQRLNEFADNVYKFFVKNIRKLIYSFLREYLFTNKNRKAIIASYSDVKLPSYPKEQYGKKDYYILIAKLPSIIRDIITDDDMSLSQMISYIKKNRDTKLYVDYIEKYCSEGLIDDDGVYDDIMKLFEDSNSFEAIINKLQIDITECLINPYIESIGMMGVKLGVIESPDTDNESDTVEDSEE